MSVGISAWGAYAPRLRLQRKAVTAANAWIAPNLAGKGKGERAMANWDEDSVTMAVEAARDALGPDDDRSRVDTLYFASSTAPYADRLNAGIVCAALALDRFVASADFGGSQRAGLGALAAGLAAVKAGTARTALVAAADHRRALAASSGELDWGDGAAAFLVSGSDVAAEYLGHGSVTADFIDHYREADAAFDYGWEERWVRDEGIAKLVPPALEAPLASAGIGGEAVTHFCFPCTFAGLAATMAKAAGIRPEAVRDNLAASIGETGAAHGLFMLAHALEQAKAGDIVLAAQFGQGAEALVFRVTERAASARPARGVTGALADRKEETNYLKLLYFNDMIPWDKGMRAETETKTALTTLYRYSDAIMGLVGGRDTVTGVVQFPRSRISVSPNNPSVDTQEPYRLAERSAKVLTWSADYLSYSPSPPNHYGLIDFDGGGRIYMDITDVEPGDVESEIPVRLVFRIKQFDEKRNFPPLFLEGDAEQIRQGG